MDLAITDITIGKRHRKDFGDIAGLAASIERLGLLHPVVVDPDYRLIVGGRRIKACKKLGWEKVPARVVRNLSELGQALEAERDENTCRKDFLPSEFVLLGDAFEELERKAAKKRQGERKDVQEKKLGGKLPRSSAKSRDVIGKAAGVSGRTYEKAKAVVASGDRKLIADMDRSGKVNGVYKKLKIAKQAAAIEAEPPPLPTGPFRVVVVDPPWHYDTRSKDVSHRAANPYPSMSVEEIRELKIGPIGHVDSVLWLWTTNAFLRDAFVIAEAWGFQYKTLLTWAKNRMGTGDWLRGQTEHCLMCVRGRPVIRLTNQTTLLTASLRAHSEKPDEFFKLVEALCPGSKVEIFARKAREGWIAHGDESVPVK